MILLDCNEEPLAVGDCIAYVEMGPTAGPYDLYRIVSIPEENPVIDFVEIQGINMFNIESENFMFKVDSLGVGEYKLTQRYRVHSCRECPHLMVCVARGDAKES